MNYKVYLSIIKLCTVAVLCIVMSAAHAHHTMIATYSQTETSEIQGVVQKFNFRNPHISIYVDVTDENGSVTTWLSEGLSATAYRRAGWTADRFKTGDVVKISGGATLDGSPMVWLDKIATLDTSSGAFVDRSIVFGGGADASASKADAYKDIFIAETLDSGVPNFTGTTRSWFDPKEGPLFFLKDPKPKYNALGSATQAEYDITTDPQVFCDPPGLARQAGFTPYGFKLLQEPDKIIIDYEEYSGHREIPIGTELPDAGPKSHLGDSVARYENGALIIDTVNLLANTGNHTGAVLSDEARITEIFTREDVEGLGTRVKTTISVSDPLYLDEPWERVRYTVFTEGYEYFENVCVPPLRNR